MRILTLLTIPFLLNFVNPTRKKENLGEFLKRQRRQAKKSGMINETVKNKTYAATWDDLDSRPLPEWYDRVKIGIFLHWGVYSVPATHNEWFWYFWKTIGHPEVVNYMKKYYVPNFSYQDFAPYFTAEYFDAREWAQFFVKTGAKYVILTSKHHDGYTLFPSKQSKGWNSVNVGPRRDIVGELGTAVKQQGLRYGLYYSLFEWYNPVYLNDKAAKFKTYFYRNTKVWPEIQQLVNDYEPAILWFDGEWEAPAAYWNSSGILSWLYNESPVKNHVVVNDRLGKETRYRHGGFYNGKDRYDPKFLQNHKWENAFTLDLYSWSYRTLMKEEDVMPMKELLQLLIRTVSCGGNVLINIGPSREGIILKIFQERLLGLGEWLEVNGEAIYDSSPWLYQNDTANGDVWYTCHKTVYNALDPTALPSKTDTVKAIYALFTNYPAQNILMLKDISSVLSSREYEVKMLGENNTLNWTIAGDSCAFIQVPVNTTSKNAWTIKFVKKQTS